MKRIVTFKDKAKAMAYARLMGLKAIWRDPSCGNTWRAVKDFNSVPQWAKESEAVA